MIKNCFTNEQPDFYKEVEVDGEKIGTVKALTKNDMIQIEDKCYKKILKDGEMIIEPNFQKAQILQIKLGLTGDKKVGWEMGDSKGNIQPVNEKNIGMLLDKYFDAFSKAINEISNLGTGTAKN